MRTEISEAGQTLLPTPENLAVRSLRAIKWNYLGTVGRIIAQLVGQITLARILGPEPFGFFGYALLVIGFGVLVTEMGLGSALVQTAKINSEEYATLCSRLLMAAVIGCLLVFFSANWIAVELLAAPEATPFLQAVVPIFLINALSIPAASLLQRELRFKALQLIQLGSYVFGYLFVGIGIALLEGGAWSLVAAWFAQLSAACLMMYLLVPKALMLGNPLRGLKLAGFGRVVMTTNLVNWLVENAPHLFIGRLFGPAALGLFTVANNLVRTPANHLVVSMQAVLFPLSSLAQDNLSGLRRAYLTALSGVSLVAFPIFIFAAMQADTIVVALLGVKWVASGAVLSPLALAMIPHTLMAIAGPMLSGKGEPGVELRVQLVMALVMMVALTVAAQWSFAAMVWTLSAVFLVRCVWMTAALACRFRIDHLDLYRALRGAVLLSLLVVGISVGADELIKTVVTDLPALVHLVAKATLVLATTCVLVLIWPAACLDSHLASLVGRLLSGYPVQARWRFLARVHACSFGALR